MCAKLLSCLGIMQKWLSKDKIEMSIGTFQASQNEIEVKIDKNVWQTYENGRKTYTKILCGI